MTAAHGQKTALITGASSGIGYELTMLFARDGYDLVLIARSEARLAQVADDVQHRHGVAVRVLAHDQAQPTAAAQIVAQLQEEDLTIEALVNNAGFATYGPFVATDLATELEMIQVNVVALTQLTNWKLVHPMQVHRFRPLTVSVLHPEVAVGAEGNDTLAARRDRDAVSPPPVAGQLLVQVAKMDRNVKPPCHQPSIVPLILINCVDDGREGPHFTIRRTAT